MIRGSRVVILRDGKILFIHRIKHGKKYYVLPGGTIEEGESPEQTAIREAKEETNYDIIIKSLLWEIKEDVKGETRMLHVFLVGSFKGKLKLGGPEAERQSEDDQYLFEWVPVNKMEDYLIYPDGLKERLINKFSTV